MVTNDKIVSIIIRLFNTLNLNLTPFVEYKNGVYTLLILEPYSVSFDNDITSPRKYNFWDNQNTIIASIDHKTIENSLYRVFDDLIPNFTIKIYLKYRYNEVCIELSKKRTINQFILHHNTLNF
jgi:hypothetical protein